jgi:hypothetical protein
MQTHTLSAPKRLRNQEPLGAKSVMRPSKRSSYCLIPKPTPGVLWHPTLRTTMQPTFLPPLNQSSYQSSCKHVYQTLHVGYPTRDTYLEKKPCTFIFVSFHDPLVQGYNHPGQTAVTQQSCTKNSYKDSSKIISTTLPSKYPEQLIKKKQQRPPPITSLCK